MRLTKAAPEPHDGAPDPADRATRDHLSGSWNPDAPTVRLRAARAIEPAPAPAPAIDVADADVAGDASEADAPPASIARPRPR